MALFVEGNMIKELREKIGLSQEELSYGICAVSTLSKIENCLQNPSRKKFSALLSKLGISLEEYSYTGTENEKQRKEIEATIFNMINQNHYNYADLLSKYKEAGEMENLERQFYLFAHIISEKNIPPKITVEKLLEIIKITIPSFSIDNIKAYRVYTLLEIMILNRIAFELMKEKKLQESLNIFVLLKNHYEHGFFDEKEKQKFYINILLNIIECFISMENIDMAIRTCDKAIDYCIAKRTMNNLDLLFYMSGRLQMKLNNRKNAENLFKTSITLMKILKKKDSVQEIIQKIKTLYNIYINQD